MELHQEKLEIYAVKTKIKTYYFVKELAAINKLENNINFCFASHDLRMSIKGGKKKVQIIREC